MYEQLVNTLKDLGGKATNKALQNKLGWDKPTYLEHRAKALQEGLIVLARGRGGSVVLPDYAGLNGPDLAPIKIKRGVMI